MDTRPKDTDTRPTPTPEGALIAATLKQKGISVRSAARQADISEGWWRQITKGYQNLSGGGFGPVRGPADTLARMARAAGVTADQLEEAGRADAAQELRALTTPPEPAPVHPTRQPDLRATIIAAALEGLTAEEAETLLEEELRRRREAPPGEGNSRRVS